MQPKILFLICCLMAALIPFWSGGNQVNLLKSQTFPGWPKEYAGIVLQPLPFSGIEKDFYRYFPGKARKFTAGNREIIIRWTTGATRKLHPAVECFRASGYRITHLPLFIDTNQTSWGSFAATRKNLNFVVYERIFDTNGQNWTDVSSWFWAALLGKTTSPWWSFTVVEIK